MSMAMIPVARTFENAPSSVFLILPARVAMTTYFPSEKSRVVSSARTLSPDSTGSRFTMALPRAFDATSGIWCTFSQYSRPRSVKTSTYACVEATKRRSEEHTSELQSRGHLVCRLLLEKKKQIWKQAAAKWAFSEGHVR